MQYTHLYYPLMRHKECHPERYIICLKMLQTCLGGLAELKFSLTAVSSASKVGVVVKKDGVTISLQKGKEYSAADIQALLVKAKSSGNDVTEDMMKSVQNATVTGTGVTNRTKDWKTLSASTATAVANNGKPLTLQIGDTSASYNKLDVTINDCHTGALGIADLDIGNQTDASDALKTIKDAINYVSDVRGTLGATQNRLDHTINNLSVMQENIQDAESTIRDTDVADEMMAYTKNNILIQSAQAMLAQANQVPQGVLQLLQ